MPQLRKSAVCIVVISVVAAVFVSLLPSVEVSPIADLPSQPAPQKDVPPVPPRTFEPPTRQPSEQQLLAGVPHFYPLPMQAGDLLELIVDQKGVDLEVEIFDPRGKLLFTVDSPNGKQGPERVLLVAGESASYRAQVSTPDPSGDGRYRIWIAMQRRATPKEVQEAGAEELFFQAKEAKEPFSSRESKLQKAARLWDQTGNDGRQADALRLLGKIYAEGGQHQKSIEVRRRAKSLYRQARLWANEGGLANDIGTSHVELSELDAAAKSYAEALALGKRAGEARVAAAALYGLGFIAWRQGKSTEALESLEQSRMASKGVDAVQEGRALTASGGVFADAGKTDLAIERYKAALAIFERSGNEGQKAIALTGMGYAYIKRRDPKRAQDLYQKALKIQQRVRDEDHMLVTLNGLGLAFLNQGKPEDALGSFLKSHQLVLKKASLAHEARLWTNLGWTYSELGRENEAYAAYEQALSLGQKTNDPWMKTAALLGFALLEEARRNPIAARVQAEAAVRSVEEIRATTRPDLKIAVMASQQDVYDALIDILLWQHEIQPSEGFDAQALRISEQGRSRGLLDKVLERFPAERTGEIPQQLRVLSLAEIQRSVLDSETLLLEYHLGRRASYLWLVDKTSLRIFKLPPREELESLVERTYQLLMISNREEKKRAARRLAKELSGILLGPAVAFLGQKRLLISAPGLLQTIPFSALPDPAALEPETESNWPRPLIVNHEVIKVPSASVLAALQARADVRTPPQELLAMLADPVFDVHDERFERVGVALQEAQSNAALELFLGPLKRLPHARSEAHAILREIGARGAFTAFDFDASRGLVLSGKLSNFRNVHIATHGLSRDDNAEFSALVFSLMDPQGRHRDGLLRAPEIYELDIPADLVTLSACKTGLGERVPGEGLMGLSHAFFAAGATRVVVSLWEVNDLATAKLMGRFYNEYLTQGHSPPAALREAQKAMWRSPLHNAPFYWGGFELQGDWRAVESPR